MTAAVNSVGKKQGSAHTDGHNKQGSTDGSKKHESDKKNDFDKSNSEALKKDLLDVNLKREVILKKGLFETQVKAAAWLNENAGGLQDKHGAEVGANIAKIYGTEKGWTIGEIVTSEHSTYLSFELSVIPSDGAYYDPRSINDNADWHTHPNGSHNVSKGVGFDSHTSWKNAYVSFVGSDGKAHMSLWNAPSAIANWPISPKDYSKYESCVIGTC
jgi:hypothetical protein